MLVRQDSDEDRTRAGVLFSDNMRRKRVTGIVLLHQPGWYWSLHVNEDVEGKRVLFEKWAWREVELGGHRLLLVPEQATQGVMDPEETDMNKQQVLDAINAEVKEIVDEIVPDDDNEELTGKQVEELKERDIDFADTVEGLEEAELGDEDEVEKDGE